MLKPTETPVLETERHVMRGYARADFDDVAALWADPTTIRYIGGKTFEREEVWQKFLRSVGHWPIMGFGYWVVRDRATSRFVGEVGFGDFKRAMEPSLNGAPEAGWVIAPWAHGQGRATECVNAALAWGDANLRVARTVCTINDDNVASIRVARKCGFAEYARTSYKGDAVVLYERMTPG